MILHEIITLELYYEWLKRNISNSVQKFHNHCLLTYNIQKCLIRSVVSENITQTTFQQSSLSLPTSIFVSFISSCINVFYSKFETHKKHWSKWRHFVYRRKADLSNVEFWVVILRISLLYIVGEMLRLRFYVNVTTKFDILFPSGCTIITYNAK